MNLKHRRDAQINDRSATASPLATVLVVLTITVCILSCALILAVPTGSIDATTVYRGF